MVLEASIQEEILDGRLLPGSRINISKLKARYGVGLAPLREALSRLVNTGLVKAEKNKGYTVTSVSECDLIDLYEACSYIEQLALKQSIERGEEAWEEGVVASLYNLKKVESNKSSFKEWSDGNSRFHNALIDACGDVVKELRRIVGIKLERYVRLAFKEIDVSDYCHQHQAIADAVLARDIELSQKLIHEHCMSGLEIHIQRFRGEQGS